MALTQTERQILEQTPEDRLLGRAMEVLHGRLALVSSFGAESALLLAMIAEIDPEFPVFSWKPDAIFPKR